MTTAVVALTVVVLTLPLSTLPTTVIPFDVTNTTFPTPLMVNATLPFSYVLTSVAPLEIKVVSMPLKNLPLPIKKSPAMLPVASTFPIVIKFPPVTLPVTLANPDAVILLVTTSSNCTLAMIAVLAIKNSPVMLPAATMLAAVLMLLEVRSPVNTTLLPLMLPTTVKAVKLPTAVIFGCDALSATEMLDVPLPVTSPPSVISWFCVSSNI